MRSITELAALLSSMAPALSDGEFVFVSRPGASYGDGAELSPVATVAEDEGLTLIVPKNQADDYGEHYDGVFRRITLGVHSSLAAVGLTAAVAGALAQHGISANVVAAYHHDHVFVPSERAAEAVAVLSDLATPEE